MAGVDARTFRVLSGWPHVVQSLQKIYTTRIGERVMRRWIGSEVPPLLGENISPTTVLRYVTAIIWATELYEPRFKIREVLTPRSANAPERLRTGTLSLALIGEYRPRGHLGDPTPERGSRTLFVGSGGVLID